MWGCWSLYKFLFCWRMRRMPIVVPWMALHRSWLSEKICISLSWRWANIKAYSSLLYFAGSGQLCSRYLAEGVMFSSTGFHSVARMLALIVNMAFIFRMGGELIFAIMVKWLAGSLGRNRMCLLSIRAHSREPGDGVDFQNVQLDNIYKADHVRAPHFRTLRCNAECIQTG